MPDGESFQVLSASDMGAAGRLRGHGLGPWHVDPGPRWGDLNDGDEGGGLDPSDGNVAAVPESPDWMLLASGAAVIAAFARGKRARRPKD